MAEDKSSLPSVILGMGEVGTAHYEILSKEYSVIGHDLKQELERTNCEDLKELPETYVLHIAIRYDEDFERTVWSAVQKFHPFILNILTTVPPGTTEKFGLNSCHSTTRGLHPNLISGLYNIKKHIGGFMAEELKIYFEDAGISCETHPNPRTTELLHLLNNAHYGVNLMFADEAYELCRKHGVDYYDFMRYCQTNNEGYARIGHATKVRPILTPPNKNIGGHCVTMSARLIENTLATELIKKLAHYNEDKKLNESTKLAG